MIILEPPEILRKSFKLGDDLVRHDAVETPGIIIIIVIILIIIIIVILSDSQICCFINLTNKIPIATSLEAAPSAGSWRNLYFGFS